MTADAENGAMEAEFLTGAEQHPILGPNYFVGRKIARDFMEKFEPEAFNPLIDRFADELRERVWNDFLEYLLSDTEANLANAIWRRIDICIEALMAGEHWAVERYALMDRYGDGEKVRKAVAKHIPKEIMDGRIADLEKEVAQLKKDLEWARR